MNTSQSFEILDTQKPKIFVTTTGITEIEKTIIKKNLPSHIHLEDELTPLTKYLVSYKSIVTDKLVQAFVWNIKLVSIDWFYDSDTSPTKYFMRPYEGIEFSAHGISNEIYINFLVLQGAIFNENLTISAGFFVSNIEEGDKLDFCKKYGIPVIQEKDIFKNNFLLFKKSFNLNALRINITDIFNGKIIYVDQTLEKSLFNKLKRLIIQYDGIRVSLIDANVDFVITKKNHELNFCKCELVHYQYIFDCVEYRAELIRFPYLIQNNKKSAILKNVVCCIDKSIKKDAQQIRNKLKALGSLFKEEVDLTCTHLIFDNKHDFIEKKLRPYKLISKEWINQCLYTMQFEKEEKYLIKKEVHGIFADTKDKSMAKILTEKKKLQIIFQFTGLPSLLKNKAMEILTKYNIKYIVSDKYEKCTHLIMGSLTTSEKFLSALCNGAFILTPEFIDKFDNSTNFNYEKYEWKSDCNTDIKDKKLIDSIKKWRKRVSQTGYPAFYKWRVKLYADDIKKANYQRIIENGGGIMTDTNYTHCFVAKNYEKNKLPKKVLSTDYIFSYLFK